MEELLTVSGNIDADTTWNGRVVVENNVYVKANATLTINPGTVVKFMPDKSLTVQTDATLNAVGTKSQPIYFTSIRDDTIGGDTEGDGDLTTPFAGDWFSIHSAGGTASLDHVLVRYGGGSWGSSWNKSAMLRATEATAILNVSNSVLTDAFYDGVLAQNGQTTITNTVVAGADRGLVAWSSASDVDVINSTFDDNRIGLLGHGGTLDVVNTIVSNSFDVGIDNDIDPDPTVRYSNLYTPAGENSRGFPDPLGSDGNVSVDPEYRDATGGNYQLDYASPMIDAADGSVAPDNDAIGAPRYDDPRTENTGVATSGGAYADMGALEFVEGAESDIDLVVTTVGGPAVATAGERMTVQ